MFIKSIITVHAPTDVGKQKILGATKFVQLLFFTCFSTYDYILQFFGAIHYLL